MNKVPMTPQGYKKLQDELKRLKSEERPRVIQDIEEARGHGDLTENAEYDAAKERQQQIEHKMKEIEDKLARAQIIRPEEINSDKVVFGARVVLTDLENDRRLVYQLVGEDEADRSQGKISILSPLARSMIGKSIGDMFIAKLPVGEREYVVEEISFD